MREKSIEMQLKAPSSLCSPCCTTHPFTYNHRLLLPSPSAPYTAYGLKQLLGGVPREVETLVFPNYETAVERDNVRDPFTEVTMFKRNFDHVIKDVYFKHYKETSRGNPNYFLTYGNGKAAARIVPGLRPNGAHRFHNYNHAPMCGCPHARAADWNARSEV